VRRHAASLIAALLALMAPAQADEACRRLTHEGAGYAVCTVHIGQDDLRLWLEGADGAVLGSFAEVDALLRAEGRRLRFAMNAGMYHPDRRPVGLLVERGEERAPLVRSSGGGNFGLVPNGVFCATASRAEVIETESFRSRRPACDWATQSGPMLVIGGKLHPRFLADSQSRYIRNGVGVSADGRTAQFAISDQAVTFHQFARLFRDVLQTPDALYLDGSISRLYAPGLGRADFGFQAMGPIIGVTVPLE
jgi:uncharacterized protein YigE (DUF2233 family)